MKQEYWELIAKETSLEEDNKVKQLMKTNKEFHKTYSEAVDIWDNNEYEDNIFDKNRIKSLIRTKINNYDKQRNRKLFFRISAVAAMFIAFFGVLFLLTNDLDKYIAVSNETDSVKTHILPDGSVVTLNKGALFCYKIKFMSDFQRIVRIDKGEAFFEIIIQNGKPFYVGANDFNIKVLGTKFNVRESQKGTSVVLTEGKIELEFSDTSEYNGKQLKPGEKASFNKETGKLSLTEVNTKIYTAWMYKKLEFDNFSVSELSEIFFLHYGKVLIIKDEKIAETKISGSAPADDIRLIIKGISVVLKREIIYKNDSIIIN